MHWETIKELLLQNIAVGDHIDPSSQYRYVLLKPNEHADYFRISIGARSYIKLTIKMLEDIYNATVANNGIYKRSVIYALYPKAVDNHGCHVRVVGQLFVSAGVMVAKGTDFIIV